MSDAPQPPPDQPPEPSPVPAGGWSAPAPPAPAPPEEETGWQQPPPPPPPAAPQPPPPPAPPAWGPPPTQAPPPAPPPAWGAAPTQQQALPPQWAPGPAYRPPAPTANPRPAPPTAGPRLVVAMALVAAGAAVIIAVLVAILTINADDFSFIEFTFANRLQSGTSFITLPVVLLLPLALLLAHDGGEGLDGPGEAGLSRMVVVGVTVLGTAFSVLTVVRLGANLAGDDLFVTTSTASAVFFDLACLIVAVASTLWAYRLLPSGAPPPPAPERQEGSPWAPPTLPPQSPPQAPPPLPEWPPPPYN